MEKKLITDFLEIPSYPEEEGKKSQFWDVINSEEVKQVAIFSILNEIRAANPITMSDQECRAVLAICKGLLLGMDFGYRAKNQNTATDEMSDQEDLSKL